MVKITKRIVEAAEAREKDYLIWDDELPGFGVRVFSSGKRSYVIQYRTRGRSRRYTIGLHGAWAPETARREAKVQLGRVAGGDDPVEDRQLDHKAITVKELCARYLADLQARIDRRVDLQQLAFAAEIRDKLSKVRVHRLRVLTLFGQCLSHKPRACGLCIRRKIVNRLTIWC